MAKARPNGTVRYDNSQRVVIVTGGAGGIGAAIATAFAESGALVTWADITEPDPTSLGLTRPHPTS